jgi:nucleotide-binding universal stress UspA family protein
MTCDRVAARLDGMTSIVLLCTDGSDAAIEALRACTPLLASAERIIIVTVQSAVDPHVEAGAGFTLHVTSPDDDEQIITEGDLVAKQHLDRTAAALGMDGNVELMAIVGRPGQAICDLAATLPASVVVMGTSGRGGVRRAFVGSTSDFVIRHAPCPIMAQAVGQS